MCWFVIFVDTSTIHIESWKLHDKEGPFQIARGASLDRHATVSLTIFKGHSRPSRMIVID